MTLAIIHRGGEDLVVHVLKCNSLKIRDIIVRIVHGKVQEYYTFFFNFA